MELFLLFIFLFGLIVFHELGHITFAKLLNLSIQKIGFQLKPYPHFFVAVKWPKNRLKKFIYLFSGTFFTLVLFIVSIYNRFFELPILYWAFFIQFTIETNPFYSDFTIAFVSNNKLNKGVKSYAENYKVQFQKYQYSFRWYFHFIIWTSIIISFIKLKNQIL